MEKTVSVRKTDITFSIWDLGGTRLALLLSKKCRCLFLDDSLDHFFFSPCKALYFPRFLMSFVADEHVAVQVSVSL